MKLANAGAWVAVSLVGLSLSGCGGGGTGTTNPPPPPQSREFLYVSGSDFTNPNNFDGFSLAVLSINTDTGALSYAGVSHGPGLSYGVVIDPSKKFLYVAGGLNSEVDGYSIDPTLGTLTFVGQKPITVETASHGLAIGAGGKFLYQNQVDLPTMNGVENDIQIYSVDPATGNFTFVSSALISDRSFYTQSSVFFNPNKTILYVGCPTLTTMVCGFSVNATTGALTPLNFPQPSLPPYSSALTLHPSGKFLYAVVTADLQTSTVQTFSVDSTTGAPSVTPTSSIDIQQAVAMTIDPTGHYLYLADLNHGVLAYSIDATTGALTAISNSQGLSSRGPSSLTIDPSGQFLYTSNGDGTISEYRINTQTGALQGLPGSPFTFRAPADNPTNLIAVKIP